MTTSESSSKTVLIAAAAAAAGSALLAAAAAPSLRRRLFPAPSSSSAPSDGGGGRALIIPEDIEEMEAEEEDDVITPDDVVSVFEQLYTQMQSVLAQLSGQIQQLQMAGQQIPEKQLRQLLRGEFERALLARQAKVFEEHDVDEDCLREATWEFLGDGGDGDGHPRVRRAVERFQKLWENVSGESVVGRRPGDGRGSADAKKDAGEPLSQDELLGAARVYFDALTSAMGDIVKRFKAEGKNLREPSVAQALQMEFASSANDAGEDALKGMGVTLNRFRAGIERHSQSPEVGRMLTMLQMKQQQELMTMGVPAM